MKRLGFFLLAALTACGNDVRVGAQFHGPVSLTVFRGYTHAHLGRPTPAPYLAVANSRTDELRIIDLANHSAVPSPGMAFPLSVPTDPFPTKVVSAPLGDGPDLLVVASAGQLELQLVSTWDSTKGVMRVVERIDLSAALGAGGGTILSMLGLPVPNSNPAKVRVLVGVSGGKLLAVDFERGSDGSVKLSGPVTSAKVIGFDPVDLAVDPLDGTLIYAATPDLITSSEPPGFQAFGVAAISMATDPWKVRALKAGPGFAGSAGAPTRLVAAARLGERYADNPEHFKAAETRVYAVLDEMDSSDERGQPPGQPRLRGCGLNRELSCGIVTLDPALDPASGRQTNLASDLAADLLANPLPGPVPPPAQSYRAPFVLPARAEAIAIAMPPASGKQRCVPGPNNGDPNCQSEGIVVDDPQTALLKLGPGSGTRWTTAAMVVGASDGRSYVIDLGRMAAGDDVSLLNSSDTRTQVASAFSLTSGSIEPNDAAPGLGLYTDLNGNTVTIDRPTLATSIAVSPGYTQGDSWTLAYHGALPSLVAREAALVNDGAIWVALQTPVRTNGGAISGWQSLGDLADPALGVQVGDYVDIVLPNPLVSPIPNGTCGNNRNGNGNGQARGVVTAFLAPDPAKYPGGALAIQPLAGGDYEITPDGLGTFCVGQIAPGSAWPVWITVRASGLVLSGAKFGYAGRPAIGSPFSVQWQEEDPLLTACPDSPRAAHQAAWGTARQACETLALARKARRFYYPAELCRDGQPCKTDNWYPDLNNGNALTTGPVIRLRAGIYPPSAGSPTLGSFIGFSTLSGVLAMSRAPSYAAVSNAALAFDRSSIPADLNSEASQDGTAFYLTYGGDVLMEFPPGESIASVTTIR